jgi:hypothetical protein
MFGSHSRALCIDPRGSVRLGAYWAEPNSEATSAFTALLTDSAGRPTHRYKFMTLD